jgi:hypothetical protein
MSLFRATPSRWMEPTIEYLMAASLNGRLTLNAVLSDPLREPPSYPIDRNVSELSSLEGQDFGATLPNHAYVYSEQWNLNIRHKFGRNTVAQLGYDGQRGLHLEQLFHPQFQLMQMISSCGSEVRFCPESQPKPPSAD